MPKKYPKASEIDELIEYLHIGPMHDRDAAKAAAAALDWVRGNMTEDDLVNELSALLDCHVDDLAPCSVIASRKK